MWDKDPLSQERMGQIGFTTEKLKDLGKVTEKAERSFLQIRCKKVDFPISCKE